MGMPVVLEIVDTKATQAEYDAIFEYLVGVDEKFSTYKEQSEVSKINRGETSMKEYSDEMREVLRLSQETFELTNGYFSITTPEGSLDPSGLVKGWAIQKAASMLEDRGYKNFYIEIAGDIQTSGVTSEGKEWSIGIRNPFVREEIVKVVYPHGKGIATSGTYVRGSHLYNPHAPEHAPDDFVSLTVLGPNVYEADRFATAAFVMGKDGMQFLEALSGFEAYAIDANGLAVMTSNFELYVAPLVAPPTTL
jgi:thiamine biosynthesis lipoprotein